MEIKKRNLVLIDNIYLMFVPGIILNVNIKASLYNRDYYYLLLINEITE